jgi:hypothetical protein
MLTGGSGGFGEEYRLRLGEGRDTVLLFDGEVESETLQAVVIQDGPEGLIQELTVVMRPLAVLRRLSEKAWQDSGSARQTTRLPQTRREPESDHQRAERIFAHLSNGIRAYSIPARWCGPEGSRRLER